MEDYIVRIYRRKEENGGVFGVVEEVGVDGRQPFRSMEELVRLLQGGRPGDRRKAERIRVAVPVTVEGRDSSGRPFSEATVLSDLSVRGAGFRLNARVVEGAELRLVIEPAGPGLKRDARVARVAEGPESRTVGVLFRRTDSRRGAASEE